MIDQDLYLVASRTLQPLQAFLASRAGLPGRWLAVTSPKDLEPEVLERLAPRYIFFVHWSAIVPETVLSVYECVCFHMTDVPYGRGGSPLQNLIARGHRHTKLTALRMTSALDAGPVYAKRDLTLDGSADAIYARAAALSLELAAWIARERPTPVPQEGEPVMFRRRTPAQSRLPEEGTLEALHDHIRMLDAPGYPHAFLESGAFRIELTGSRLAQDGSIETRAVIRRRTDGAAP